MTNHHEYTKPDARYELHDHGGYWIAHGKSMTGRLLYVYDKTLTQKRISRAFADPPAGFRLSRISQGVKKGTWGFEKPGEGVASLQSALLAFALSPEKPEFIREGYLEYLASHPQAGKLISIREHIEKAGLDPEEEGRSREEIAEEVCKIRFFAWIRKGGSKALFTMAKIAEGIEKLEKEIAQDEREIMKRAKEGEGDPEDPFRAGLSGEERDFLIAVEDETDATQNVPTIKSVRENWMKRRAGRSDEGFKRVKKRLGFDWLPPAKRGKSAT